MISFQGEALVVGHSVAVGRSVGQIGHSVAVGRSVGQIGHSVGQTGHAGTTGLTAMSRKPPVESSSRK